MAYKIGNDFISDKVDAASVNYLIRVANTNTPMAQYNRKYKDDDQHIRIAWLLVVFAIVILFLIWQAHGVL